MSALNQLANVLQQNCRIGKKYSAITYHFKRISEDEFNCNGVRIYLSMDGNWQSNPPINDPVFKSKVNDFIHRLKKCDASIVCTPVGVVGGLERCVECGVCK